MREGTMVRVSGGGPLMRVIDIFNGMARCVFVDVHGRVQQRFEYTRNLVPFWVATGPRSLWPEVTDVDLLQIEQEERNAAAARKAQRKAARKSRRSNKLARG